jgi:hypothetical protein
MCVKDAVCHEAASGCAFTLKASLTPSACAPNKCAGGWLCGSHSGCLAGAKGFTHTTSWYLHKARTRRRKKDEELETKINFLASIRAFLTFIQFVILGTLLLEGDYGFSNGSRRFSVAHCVLSTRKSLFKDADTIPALNDLKLRSGLLTLRVHSRVELLDPFEHLTCAESSFLVWFQIESHND